MPNIKLRSRIAGCLCLLSVSACGGADLEHVDQDSQRFSTAPGEANHEEVTRAGLSFLRAEIATAIVAANVATDVEFALVNANHFDDCNFSGGSRVIASSEAAAVSALQPSLPLTSDALAIVHFGRALHASQDFYAHSNWVELNGSTLLDRSLGAFPVLTPYTAVPSTGFVLIQGRKPPTSALTRKEDAPYPSNAVVTFRLRQRTAPGLISGTVDYEPGDDCPASVAMTHDELNKDKSTIAGREQQYEAAKALATSQTRHEWCRLAALVQQAWGDAGTARLSAWLDPAAVPPDCDVD